MAELVRAALFYCAATDGLFDITMGTVTPLWNFHTGVVPGQEELEEALRHVEYENVIVDGNTQRQVLYSQVLLDYSFVLVP